MGVVIVEGKDAVFSGASHCNNGDYYMLRSCVAAGTKSAIYHCSVVVFV